MSPCADCKCPACGSTDNEHNQQYLDRLNKAWNCKHQGEIREFKRDSDGLALVECKECGSIGVADHMKKHRETHDITIKTQT